MIMPLREKFPVLDNVDSEHWDLIVTVAGVFIATSRLEHMRLTDKQKGPLLEEIANSLEEWNPDGLRIFVDCKTFPDYP